MIKSSDNIETEVLVTGLGIISSIGNNLQECLDSLRNNRMGIHTLHQLNTVHKNEYVAGEIDRTDKQLTEALNIRDEIPRTTLLALIAAKEALASANVSGHSEGRKGTILGTTVGGMDKTERLYLKGRHPKEFMESHHCGFTTSYLAGFYGMNHYTNTISTACSSAANAIMMGTRMIKHNMLDMVLAGGSDALSVFTFNGFRSLMILDQEPCKPFSEDRKGLNLGEGAAFLLIESERSAKRRGANAICKISGYGNCNDAFHQTASSPDGRGPRKAMTTAVRTAGISTGDIDYINLHGTGTDNNDLTEGVALKEIFGEKVPMFSSTKSFTGHCLGAAGAIEAVFSASAIQHNEVYANLRFSEPIADTGLVPVTNYMTVKVNHVLSNSFGFGGCDTSLIFSKPE
jgi:3-oxoacyl-[acyl-carrier-protein] synthase-1